MLLHYMPAVLRDFPFPEWSEKEIYLLVVSSIIALGTAELAYLPQPLNKRGSFLVLLVKAIEGIWCRLWFAGEIKKRIICVSRRR